MRINLPEEPTLSHDTVGECLGNGLLTSIGAATLAYIFERPMIAPSVLTFLTVSLSCLIWAWCQEKDIFTRRLKEDDIADESEEDDIADDSEEDSVEDSVEDSASPHIVETNIFPDWFKCDVTRSLGTAKAHNLFDAMLTGSINRSLFCTITGKPQSEYGFFLHNWFDQNLVEKKGSKQILTYRGEVLVEAMIEKIKAM